MPRESTPAPQSERESPILRWGAFLTPIIIAAVAFVVGYARLEPKLDAANVEVMRLRGDFIDHRTSPAHAAMAIEQARIETRVEALERAAERLDQIETRLRAIERKQDAMCAAFPTCRKELKP